MSDTSYLGSEVIPPESFLEGRKYKATYQCDRCGHIYSRTFKVVPAKDPPCPKMDCKVAIRVEQELKERHNFQSIVEHGPPGHIGNNPTVKAIDRTADIVMQDHGLTNLRDDIREGESMAPKLPPRQQAAADSFFDRSAANAGVQRKMNNLAAKALRGQFRAMTVAPHEVTRAKPGTPFLRHIGTEKL